MKAEELCRKALKIRERVLGEEHPDTAISYHNLAVVYESQGEYKRALAFYLKSFKVLVFKLGINHTNTQYVYKNMKGAFCEWDSGDNFEKWLEENMEKE